MSSSTKPSSQDGFKKPMTLGSKSRSFIPMTPRSLKTNREHHNDFARQVSEHSYPNSRGQDGQPPQKKFRSNAAPKGTRLASGYVDRASERQKEKDDEGGEDKLKRLKALEEMLKLQQIDQATFEALRDEIGIGGDTSTTHLVKGLDFKLLERIRRGDNVDEAPKEDVVETAPDEDVEDELEKALEKDVTVVDDSKTQEAQDNDTEEVDMAAIDAAIQPFIVTRAELLRRLKESREHDRAGPHTDTDTEPPQIATASEPKIDHSRFRKLETKPKTGKHKYTETINGRRREVLVITDKEGKVKRKTRWLDPESEPSKSKNGTGSSDNQVWGGDLPAEILAKQKAAIEEEAARQKALDEEDEGDIFGGVADYDPLAGLDSDEEGEEGGESRKPVAKSASEEAAENGDEQHKQATTTSKPRNYFSTTNDDEPESSSRDTTSQAPTHDPAILAALKRAAQIRQQEEADTDTKEGTTTQQPTEDQTRNKALLEKLQKQSAYNDDVDIDMGFGGNSRYDDEDEDGGDGKQKLSQWRGLGEDGGEDDDEAEKKGGGGGAKRKRGGGGGGKKKRMGDKNSFKDVMSVIEGRKKT